MAWVPTLKQMNVLEQGGRAFPNDSEWVDNYVFVASTVKNVDLAAQRVLMGLPANAPVFVIFGSDVPFWVHYHAAAAIPAGDVTDGSGSVFSPNQVYLDGTVTQISLISPVVGHISLAFGKS